MKIAYINSFYAPLEVGGAEKSVRFLAEAMVAKGHEASIITLDRQRNTAELNGVRIERLPTANLYFPADASTQSGWQKKVWHGIDSYNPMAGRQIGQLLDTLKPDVVHTNNVAGFSVAAWQATHDRRIPIVHTLRDYYLLCPNTAMFKAGQPCEARCGQCKVLGIPRAWNSKLVRHVIGNSHFILNKHLENGLFKNADSSVIYNAYLSAPPPARTTKPGKTVFGYIGRLAPTKGVGVLIEAARQACAQSTAVEVLIAGEGEPDYLRELKQQAAGLPIHFLGRVKPEDFYTQIDWTVVPSLWDEPLARVIFESFCHGVPVIGTTTGGTPELVKNGHNGILVEPGKANVLAHAMATAVSRQADLPALQINCKSQSETFSPNFVSDRYLSAYQGALKAQTN